MATQFLNGVDAVGQRVQNIGVPAAATDAAPLPFYGSTVGLTAAGTLLGGRLNTVDATNGAFTATLPAPSFVGQQLSIEKIDTSLNGVTITGTVRGVTVNVVMPGIGVAGQSVALVAESVSSWRPFNDKPLAWLDARYAPVSPQFRVVTYSGSAYPARPAVSIAPAGYVRYVGPLQPSDWLTGDEWINNS